ncbi:MAG TPA: plastocyanin/azurin family copper-binding protein [Gemmatimonadales bacterium]|nr:plastocyanin/azurin family copper-binding protein [Gemmatimonadales bacterium]
MRSTYLFSLAVVALIPVATPRPRPAAKVVAVKMVDVSATAFKFDPAAITAAPGDTVRFTQTSKTPHNVELKAVPAGVDAGASKMGPFLATEGATYDLVLDAKFAPGTYQFACTPHEMLGMRGTLTVAK